MTTIIIPTHLGSTRLYGKPLLKIKGVSLIKRVYAQCISADIGEVFVASDSQEILESIPAASQIWTPIKAENGTERVAQAASRLNLKMDQKVINVQGDMPFVPPELIREFDCFLKQATTSVVTAASMESQAVGGVQVDMDEKLNAKRFTRQEIVNGFWHIGVYGYTVRALKGYLQFLPSPNEIKESLEQNRFIDCRISDIGICLTRHNPGQEINTKADLIEANK